VDRSTASSTSRRQPWTGVDVDVFALFNGLGKKVPVLSAVAPNGPDTIDAFGAAGGARALLKQLEPIADLDAVTVTGRTLCDNLAGVAVHNDNVIRPLSRPCSRHASIVVLRGSLAPDSAIVRPGLQRPGENGRLEGTAQVFDGAPEAIAAVQQGELKRGHVLVVRAADRRAGREWPARPRALCSRSTPRVSKTRSPSSPTGSCPDCATRG
jgi:dihydroxy-acid dehydratase